jgi:hypothetical protein
VHFQDTPAKGQAQAEAAALIDGMIGTSALRRETNVSKTRFSSPLECGGPIGRPVQRAFLRKRLLS